MPTAPEGRRIVVARDTNLAEEEYRLSIGETITVTASTSTGMAWALQSLGQALQGTQRALQIQDNPDVPFRCVMIDVARRYHSPSTLRTLIRWCQAGKVRYLQLHLTDDQNWMLPTTVLSGIDKNNQHKLPAYTSQELHDLQAFARDRGVTLIPEIDIPGHSSLLVRLDPALYGLEGSESRGCIDFGSPTVRTKIKALLAETAALFPDAPYLHLGGDEAWYPNAEKDPDIRAAMDRLGPGSTPGTVFVDFVADMAETVLQLNKRPIIWEGFHGTDASRKRIPKETVIIAWEGHYYPASRIPEDGYATINAGWDPFYVVNHFPYEMFTLVPLQRLYRAESTRFSIVNWPDGKDPSFVWNIPEKVIGSMMCWWEGREWNAQKVLPQRIVAFGARLWHAAGERDYAEFNARYATLAKSVMRRAHPFSVRSSGGLATDPDEFEHALTLSFMPHDWGVRFAWRTDGRAPTVSDLQEGFTLQLKESAVVAVQAFRGTTPVGETLFRPVHKVTVVPNLALGRPVSTSGDHDPQFGANRVNDGVADQLSAYWLAYPTTPIVPDTTLGIKAGGPGGLQEAPGARRALLVVRPEDLAVTIDLGRIEPLTRIEVVAFWATGQPTRYVLQVSLDGQDWATPADASQQTAPTTKEGYVHRFSPTPARYIRLKPRGGTVFPPTMTRINEIRAFAD